MLDHPALAADRALPRLGLPRAYVLEGHMAKAAYQDFLALWKDPDIPVLKPAKAEYARLR